MRPRWLAVAGLLAAAGCTVEVSGTPTAGQAPDPEPDDSRLVFDEKALEGENGVRKVLVEDYLVPAEDIAAIDCPADQEVREGGTFDCVVIIGGEENIVAITMIDDEGTYEVGTPEAR